MDEFRSKLRQKFSSIKYKKKVRIRFIYRYASILRYKRTAFLINYIYGILQKNAPKEAETETSDCNTDEDEDGIDLPDSDKSAMDMSRSTAPGSTPRASSGASSRNSAGNGLAAHADNAHGTESGEEPDTQLLDQVGQSGMDFIVKHSANQSPSVQLPAPSEAFSNPFHNLKDMTFQDFVADANSTANEPKTGGNADPADYQLSSSESSEEDN